MTLSEEPKIGDVGVAHKNISRGAQGHCYFHGVRYLILAGTEVRKWRQVVVVRTEPTLTVTESAWYSSPSKPIMTGGYVKWSDLWLGYVDALSVAVVPAYKVKKGWTLHLGGGVVSCDLSVIQDIVMTHTPGIVGHFRYDIRGDIIFGPLSSTLINEEETLTYYVYNNDDDERFFSVSLVGVLEQKATGVATIE